MYGYGVVMESFEEYKKYDLSAMKKDEIKYKIFNALKNIDFDDIINDHNLIKSMNDGSASIALGTILANDAFEYINNAIEVSKKMKTEKVGPAAFVIAASMKKK